MSKIEKLATDKSSEVDNPWDTLKGAESSIDKDSAPMSPEVNERPSDAPLPTDSPKITPYGYTSFAKEFVSEEEFIKLRDQLINDPVISKAIEENGKMTPEKSIGAKLFQIFEAAKETDTPYEDILANWKYHMKRSAPKTIDSTDLSNKPREVQAENLTNKQDPGEESSGNTYGYSGPAKEFVPEEEFVKLRDQIIVNNPDVVKAINIRGKMTPEESIGAKLFQIFEVAKTSGIPYEEILSNWIYEVKHKMPKAERATNARFNDQPREVQAEDFTNKQSIPDTYSENLSSNLQQNQDQSQSDDKRESISS